MNLMIFHFNKKNQHNGWLKNHKRIVMANYDEGCNQIV